MLGFKAVNGLATCRMSDMLNKHVSVQSIRSNSFKNYVTFLGLELKLYGDGDLSLKMKCYSTSGLL